MRITIAVLVALGLIGLALYGAKRLGRGEDRNGAPARLDPGATGSGPAGDRGPGSEGKVSSPLWVHAQVRGESAHAVQLDIQVASGESLAAVHVLAMRYDAPSAAAPAATDTVWSGALQPGAAQRLQAEIRFGASRPARILVSARAEIRGALFGASEMVPLQPAAPPRGQVSGGVIEYRGRGDSTRAAR